MLAATVATKDRDRFLAGTFLRVIADSADTGGAFTVLEQQARRGFSPPLHIHHGEDTAMLVLDGTLTVLDEGVETVVEAGGFVWLKKDTPHSFRVESEEAHMLEFALLGGVEGFYSDASDIADLVGLPPATEPDIPRLLGAAPNYRIDIIGPPML